ncbi:hypothetical protein OCU04_012803 [Sclerotinia nivalis]|uniref:Protein kinase domain-containing protein n=1 Tax=Sclerotinia nivalis TaxID=352851 RepID=A0A9X0A9F9_9HELO|nr:hypothetical protein OCU04_012803 [Sclerotinia nivalis]
MSILGNLNDWKLQTSFDGPHFIHTSYQADWENGRRRKEIVEEWQNEGTLGRGGFGKVSLQGEVNGDGKRAVKELEKYKMRRDGVDYKKELVALIQFSREEFAREKVFVQFFGWFENDESVFLAMEYFPLGSLDNFIDENTMREKDVQIICIQVLGGLASMHERGFAHRDLKPGNILVAQKSPNWWIKIGDFGLAKRSTNDTVLQTVMGTPGYIAPEIYIDMKSAEEESSIYTNAVDIWSFACMAYEMMTFRLPFLGFADRRAFCKGGPFPENPLRFRASEEGIAFIKRALVPDPKARSTAIELLEDSWIHIDSMHTQISPSLPLRYRSLHPSSHSPRAQKSPVKSLQTTDRERTGNYPSSNVNGDDQVDDDEDENDEDENDRSWGGHSLNSSSSSSRNTGSRRNESPFRIEHRSKSEKNISSASLRMRDGRSTSDRWEVEKSRISPEPKDRYLNGTLRFPIISVNVVDNPKLLKKFRDRGIYISFVVQSGRNNSTGPIYGSDKTDTIKNSTEFEWNYEITYDFVYDMALPPNDATLYLSVCCPRKFFSDTVIVETRYCERGRSRYVRPDSTLRGGIGYELIRLHCINFE